MKVFLVTSYMKSKGGVSKYVDRLAKYLSSQNDHVTIVSLYADNQLFHYEKEFLLFHYLLSIPF